MGWLRSLLVSPAALGPPVRVCFWPAGVGLGWQIWCSQSLSGSILALALLLGLLEQAHMAGIDLEKVQTLERHPDYGRDRRLYRFAWVLITTLGVELLGFYLASFGYLGLGLLVIMTSLLGFNLAAGVHLDLGGRQAIAPAPWYSRWLVLMLDGLGLAMAWLWLAKQAHLGIAVGFLSLTLGYTLIKLIHYGWSGPQSGVS